MLNPFPDQRESTEAVLRSEYLKKYLDDWESVPTQKAYDSDEEFLSDKVNEYNDEAGNLSLRKKEMFMSTSSFTNSMVKNSYYSPTRKSFGVINKRSTRKESLANMLSKSSLNPDHIDGSKTFISSPYSQYMNFSNSSNSREFALADSNLDFNTEDKKYSDYVES